MFSRFTFGFVFLLGAGLHAQVLQVPTQYGTIQQAINAAPAAGATVLVAPGTYTPAPGYIDFVGKDVVVRASGGASVTTIQGNGLLPVVQILSGETGAAVLDGFTIAGGGGVNGVGGGGILIALGSSPTIQHCIVAGNTARGGDGGGILCIAGADAWIENNVIHNNIADRNGGGIAILDSAPTVVGNSATVGAATGIFGNNATGNGGGIFVAGVGPNGSSPTLRENLIATNGAVRGAGLFVTNSAPFVFDNTISFNGGPSTVSGGGAELESSSARFELNRVLGNTSTSSGGGVQLTLDSSRVLRNLVIGNLAETVMGRATGGGIALLTSSGSVLDGNLIAQNDARSLTLAVGSGGIGGGIYATASPASVWNNWIVRNRAGQAGQDGEGGGFYVIGPAATLIANTVCDNQASTTGGGIFCVLTNVTAHLSIFANNTATALPSTSQWGIGLGTLVMNVCDSFPQGPPPGSTASVSVSPAFLPGLLDYRLATAGNAGLLDAAPLSSLPAATPALDILGAPRPSPASQLADMGAHEAL